jgi:hypothetical protein
MRPGTHALSIIQELEKANEVDWARYTMKSHLRRQLVWQIPFEMAPADPLQQTRSP